MIRTTIKETNIRLVPMHRRYFERKLTAVEKLLDPSDTLAALDAEIERTSRHHRQGDIFRAEINLRAARGSFRAEAHGESVTAAIDGVKDEIVGQLTQQKDKAFVLGKKGARQIKEGLREAAA